MANRANADRRNVLVPLACAAAGVVAGAIYGGGGLVKTFDWETKWNIDAPRADVFAVLNAPDEQYRWWPSMVVEHVEKLPGPPERPEMEAITYRVIQAPSVRRIAPPFILHAIWSHVEGDWRIRSVVTGDLAGVLDILLYDRPDGGTRIVFHWYVRVTNPLLNALGYALEPVYRASHDHVMREGEAGLRAYMAARVLAAPTP